MFSQKNWASWIRTNECGNQNPVPYRLAIAHRFKSSLSNCMRKGGYRDSNPGSSEPQSDAITNFAIPTMCICRASTALLSYHPRFPSSRKKNACQKGFEPPTHGLEGRCSIRLSYWHGSASPAPKTLIAFRFPERVAGIEPAYPAWKAGVLPLNYTRLQFSYVGVTGFEPATSWSQTRRSDQTELHPAEP